MEKIKNLYIDIIDKLELMGDYNRPLDYFIDEYIIMNNLEDKYPLMDKKIKTFFEQELSELSNSELEEFYSYCIDKDVSKVFDTTNDQYFKIAMGLLNLNENDHFLDLGSGNGLLIKKVLDNYKVGKATGIELLDRKYLISKMILSNYNNVNLINGNFNSLHIDFDKAFLNPGYHLKNYSSDSSFQAVETLIRLLKESSSNKRAVIILRGTHLYSNRFKEDINSIIETGLVEGIISCSNFSNQIILVLTTEQHDSIKLLDGHLNRKIDEKQINEIINSYFNEDNKVLKVSNEILIEEENISPSRIKNRLVVDEKIKNYRTVLLSDICDISIGSQYTFNILDEKYEKLNKRNLGTAFKIIKASDIDEDGQCDYDELPYYSIDKINKERLAKKGDILITSKTTNYKVCVLDEMMEDDYVIPSGGMFILHLKNRIDPYYIKAYFESESGRLAMDSAFKGEKVRVLNLSSLGSVQLPLLDDDHETREVAFEYRNHMRRLRRYKREIKNLRRLSVKETNKIFK